MQDFETTLDLSLLDSIARYTEILTENTNLAENMVPISKRRHDSARTLEYLTNAIKKRPTCSFCTTLCKAGLFLVKELRRETGSDTNSDDSVQLLEHITQNKFASSECRAESFYILGMEYLESGRECGELYSLWSGHSSLSGIGSTFSDIATPQLDKARELFLQAASFAGPASSLQSRNILRSLALVAGPETAKRDVGISAGELIHSSIGSSARQTVSRTSAPTSDSGTMFGAFDCPFSDMTLRRRTLSKMYEIGHGVIPATWDFVAMAICPTGEVLLSVLKLSNYPIDGDWFTYHTVCIFPDKPNRHEETSQFEETILQAFDDIMEQSKRQLSGINLAVANEKFNSSKETKQAWWEERYDLDEELHKLLQGIDTQYFKPSCIQDLLAPAAIGDDNEEDDAFCGGNLSAMFEAACAIDDNDTAAEGDSIPSKDELQKLTVAKLKERLQEVGVDSKEIRSVRKAGLIDLLHAKLSSNDSPTTSPKKISPERLPKTSSSSIKPTTSCTFLILDENLRRLPIEGVDTLQGKTICRIPSLPFAIASLCRMGTRERGTPAPIDPSKTKYVLDPESNLIATQERIDSVLSTISEQNSWEWKGTVGEPPSKTFMQRALKEKNSLYLYFGHGAGERFFSRADIEGLHVNNGDDDNMQRHTEDAQQCQSSIILMGCSSGDLVSVNTQRGSHVSENHMYFEPEGAALSYLCAGAPCVVGNLWDVTDRDIDRFSVSLLEGIFQENETTIADCVKTSRDACKLKYMVGAAPVVYGIPVSIKRQS